MALTFRMRKRNSIKHPDAVSLKFGGRFFTSLIMLGLQSKSTVSSTIKENNLRYCRKFFEFVAAVII